MTGSCIIGKPDCVIIMDYDGHDGRMPRRKFIEYALKGAGGLVASTAVGQLLMSCSPEQATPTRTPKPEKPHQQTIHTISNVRNGLVTPGAYIREITYSMSEIARKKSSGMLQYILYNPTDDEVSQAVRESMIGRGYAGDAIEDVVYVSLDAYHETQNDARNVATVTPATVEIFGSHIPMHVIFNENFADHVESDEEFRMHTRHELVHVEDFYNGITLGNFHITGNQPEISPEFIKNIGELRATHYTSMQMYELFRGRGTFPVSKNYFGHETSKYASYWKMMKRGGTKTETMLAELQLAEFSDMVPEEIGNRQVKITFDVMGEKQTFFVK